MQSNCKFVGEFNDGRAEEGVLEFENGDRYQGDVLEMQMHGMGKFTDKLSGKSFIGQFKNGKRTGQGKLELTDGKYFVGNFENDKRCGFGQVFNETEEVEQDGYWMDDVFIGEALPEESSDPHFDFKLFYFT